MDWAQRTDDRSNGDATISEALKQAMIVWRRDLHARPELAFQEVFTSSFIARQLENFGGIEVHRGVGGTGVVGVLRGGRSPRAVALRAEMDALPIEEENSFPHKSVVSGCMHGCGHDGHMAMLLGAASHLAATRRFDGAVVFVFQPGEENAGGARRMIDEGFFRQFPVDAVFGLHNLPGMPEGSFATRQGPVMAAVDTVEIRIAGKGTHAAFPHRGTDPVVVAAEIILAAQTVVSRRIDPSDSAVVSLTRIESGNTWNVIPNTALIHGCFRYFDEELGRDLARFLERIVRGICSAHGAAAEFRCIAGYPPTVNADGETRMALEAARDATGAERVDPRMRPLMASEDFSYFLGQRPGCMMFIGNGAEQDRLPIHSPSYDFNDALLPLGTLFWTRLVERYLNPGN